MDDFHVWSMRNDMADFYAQSLQNDMADFHVWSLQTCQWMQRMTMVNLCDETSLYDEDESCETLLLKKRMEVQKFNIH